MTWRIASIVLVGTCLLCPGRSPGSAIEGTIIQVIKGTQTTPALNGAVNLKTFSKWVYVLVSDWEEKEGRVMQYEKMADGTLKFVKVALPTLPEGTSTGSLFFGQFEIKTLSSGKGIAYLNAVGKCESPTPLFRYTIDESTGDWTKLDTTLDLGGRMFWTPDEKFVYFPGSANSKQMKGFSVNPATAALSPVKVLPQNGSGTLPGLALISNDGKYVYASGSDGLSHKNNYYITAYPRNPDTGDIELKGQTISVKNDQWDWAGMQIFLTPSGKEILALGGSSNNVVVYKRNAQDGSLMQDHVLPTHFPEGGSVSDLLWYNDNLAFATNPGHHGTKLVAIPLDDGRVPDDGNKIMDIASVELVLGFDLDRTAGMIYLPVMCHPDNGKHTPATLHRNQIVAIKLKGLEDFGPAKGQPTPHPK